MIKFYAYYNHGGYKDFYLGSNQDDVEYKYFLPLLAIHEQSLVDNPNGELSLEVERQKLLPKLVVLSDNTEAFNYPSAARTLMSHSGYKLLYRQLNPNTFVLAIRDIPGSLDSYGRRTPYNVMFLCNNRNDCRALDIIANYIRCNMVCFESFLNSVFENDLVENGLKVHLKRLNSEINRIISTGQPLFVDEALNKSVRLVVIPKGMEISNVLHEQNFSKYDIYACYSTDGELLYKTVNAQQNMSYSPPIAIHSKEEDVKSPKRSNEPSNPSLHAMLNVPKREDIQKLWDYIYKLEKRISNLENNK